MATEREESLIAQIKALNIVPPEHLTEKDLEDCLNFAKEKGTKQSDIDKLFPAPKQPKATKPAEPAPQPPATEKGDPSNPPAGVITMTQAELDQKISAAAALAANNAIEVLLRNQLPQAAAVAPPAPQVIHVDGSKTEKPNVFDSRQVPTEDFLDEEFTVFHINFGHLFDKFHIGGRLIDPPYSKFILFEPYNGPETMRFGVSENLVYMCVHRTRSKKIKEMFLADERWGADFWNQEGHVDNEEVEYHTIVSRIQNSLNGYDMSAIKAMADERKIPITNLATMRTKIALYDAKKEQEGLKAGRVSAEAEKSKAALMTH